MASSTSNSRKRRHHRSKRHSRKSSRHESPLLHSSGQSLSAEALAKLDRLNQRNQRNVAKLSEARPKRLRHTTHPEAIHEETRLHSNGRHHNHRRRRRMVSGELLEEGEYPRLKNMRGGEGDYNDPGERKVRKKRIWLGIAVVLFILFIIILAIVVSKNKKKIASPATSPSTSDSTKPSNSNLDGILESSIPEAARGTDLDPFSWYDTTDFNVTFTSETVGNLPIMGCNSTWDDSKSANPNTPRIADPWGSYAERPARGVNLGGWLSLEPFITPSMFNYLGVVDEYTLVSHLGSSAKEKLEKHYATFVTEQTFADIADVGLDHVRIPFPYWAVAIYDGDQYVFRVSWRYLLRGIEWARKYGLRINLDLHSLPGSQNGWNHSGRLGSIGWLNGTNGNLNSRRSLEIHDQLSQFFAQERYRNIISFYGLANEPKMTAHDPAAVMTWTSEAFSLVRKNGITAYIVFGDGFMGITNWKGKLQGHNGLVLDAHQYVIFNKDLIAFSHTKKIEYACSDWTLQAQESMSISTGFGPTIFAEWSQADTDCALNLNNVGWGNRWTGTYDPGDPALEVLSPGCPLQSSRCECTSANSDPRKYSSTYKLFLQTFAEAQMASFEKGWGWFYWTWKTEAATQWSYQLGLEAGILPAKAYAPKFSCSSEIPSFAGLPESY